MSFRHYHIAFFCVFATSLARKSQGENEWPFSNTMSKENGEQHENVQYSDTGLYMDDSQGWEVDNSKTADWSMGSGDGSNPQDDEWGSAYDDSEWGSGVPPPGRKPSKCQQLREDLRRQPIEGAFLPKCRADGEYQARQCDEYSRQCWCVDEWGQEIAFTRGSNVKERDCLGHGEPEPPYRPQKPGAGPPENTDPGYDTRPRTESPDDEVYYPPKDSSDHDSEVEIKTADDDDDLVDTSSPESDLDHRRSSIITTPGLLPGIIGGAVVGLLCAVLLVMFIVYRMRKKDEGSYALEEPKMTSPSRGYTRAPTKEYWA